MKKVPAGRDLFYIVVKIYEGEAEPSLRFSVGRSSSVEVPLPLPLSVEGLSAVARRSVGRSLLSLSFCTLWRFWMDARRPFTFSNSEVSTTYSGRAGRTVLILSLIHISEPTRPY